MSHLLIVFLAFLLLTVIALATEHFTTRGLLADANVANDRLRMVMASGRSAGWEWDLTSGRDYWFDDLQTMFGVQSDTWSGTVEEFFSVYIPKIASVSRKRWQMQGLIISPTRRNSGSFVGMVRSVWVTATGSFYYMKSGKPERMLGMVVDITERKHAEEGLKKSEEKFSKGFRASPMALTLTSAKDCRYLDINETFERITGWSRDEVTGRTPFDIQIWVNPQERIGLVERLQAEGSVRDYEVHFRCKDGSTKFGLGSAELIEIANEPCIISVIADITESKQIQEKLRES